MKSNFFVIFVFSLLMVSCASIPKETIILSNTIGSDLQSLHDSHRNMIQLYYSKVRNDITAFIDNVYSPFVIHHVLELELNKYKKGESSIYGIIESAGKVGGKSETEEALNVMLEFCQAANQQITIKKEELLSPILNQEREILDTIDQSYHNIIYANVTLTAYLSSIRKIKESQSEALSIVGLNGLDDITTKKMVEMSEFMDAVIKKGNMLDIKSAEAQQQIEDVINKIKKITNKTTK